MQRKEKYFTMIADIYSVTFLCLLFLSSEDEAIRDGKITFKKPVKKVQDTPTDVSDSGNDKSAAESVHKSKNTDKKKKDKEKKQSNLLSFGDEEEEEEDG